MFSERWSDQAMEDYENITHYLIKKWSEKEALAFITKTEQIVQMICQMPKMFPGSIIYLGARRAVLSKHHTLYYRILERTIEIITIFDNRQSKEKINI